MMDFVTDDKWWIAGSVNERCVIGGEFRKYVVISCGECSKSTNIQTVSQKRGSGNSSAHEGVFAVAEFIPYSNHEMIYCQCTYLQKTIHCYEYPSGRNKNKLPQISSSVITFTYFGAFKSKIFFLFSQTQNRSREMCTYQLSAALKAARASGGIVRMQNPRR